jgi:hypothetical protein
MPIPNVVRVVVLGSSDGLPVDRMVVLMTGQMPHKNSYDFGPKVSGPMGEVVFSREEMVQDIALCRSNALMDYAGDINDIVGIEVYTPDAMQVQRIIDAREMWGRRVPEWRLSKQMIGFLKTANNGLYRPARVVLCRNDFKDILDVRLVLDRI